MAQSTERIRLKVVYRVTQNKQRCICILTTSYALSASFANGKSVVILREREEYIALFTLSIHDVVTLAIADSDARIGFSGDTPFPLMQSGLSVGFKKTR